MNGINDTIQNRLQAAPAAPVQQGNPLDSAQAMLKQVSSTNETQPTQTAQELNQTALALFMVIDVLKVMAQKIQTLEGGQPPAGV